MSLEENKAVMRRWIEAWNEGNVDAPEVRGPEQEKQLMANMVAEEDKVVVRYTVGGTHKGELMGIPPTDKRVALTATETYRLAGEQWVNVDAFGMMQQIGAIPQPGESVEPSH